MAIEHTIGNRTHVIEKKRDRDGRIREQQHFVNLNQSMWGVLLIWLILFYHFIFLILDEAEDFDREFATRVRRNFGGTSGERYRAIEHGSGSSRPNLSSETREIRVWLCFRLLFHSLVYFFIHFFSQVLLVVMMLLLWLFRRMMWKMKVEATRDIILRLPGTLRHILQWDNFHSAIWEYIWLLSTLI